MRAQTVAAVGAVTGSTLRYRTSRIACWCDRMQARLLMAPTAASLPAGPAVCTTPMATHGAKQDTVCGPHSMSTVRAGELALCMRVGMRASVARLHVCTGQCASPKVPTGAHTGALGQARLAAAGVPHPQPPWQALACIIATSSGTAPPSTIMVCREERNRAASKCDRSRLWGRMPARR